MSLYRSPQRRPVRAIAVSLLVGVVIGGVAGYLAAQARQESPSLAKALLKTQATIRPAVDGISLIAVEYPIGAKDGKIVVPGQLQGARDQLARVRSAFAAARPDLAVLDPGGTAKVAADLDQLGAKIEALAPEADVTALVTAIEGELRTVARLS
jgi:hypothetical protein